MSFSFPARESTLWIVLPGVSVKLEGFCWTVIIPFALSSSCLCILDFYGTSIWKILTIMARAAMSPFCFPPFFTFWHETHISFSHAIQHKLHEISFLSQIQSVKKNNGQNVPTDKWHCNKLSSKSIEKKFISPKLTLGNKKKTPHLLFHPYPFLCQINHQYIIHVFFSFKIKLATWTLCQTKATKPTGIKGHSHITLLVGN